MLLKIHRDTAAATPGIAKHSATTAAAASAVVPKVEKLVGVGEARPPGFGKCSAASVSESEHAESSDEASSSGEEAPHWIAKYNLQDFVETVKVGGKWQRLPRKDCRKERRFTSENVQRVDFFSA